MALSRQYGWWSDTRHTVIKEGQYHLAATRTQTLCRPGSASGSAGLSVGTGATKKINNSPAVKQTSAVNHCRPGFVWHRRCRPESFMTHFTVFVLACFVGYQVILDVSHSLHTPLMSVTNAITQYYRYWRISTDFYPQLDRHYSCRCGHTTRIYQYCRRLF